MQSIENMEKWKFCRAKCKLIFKAVTASHSDNNIRNYQTRVVLVILHPKLILQ